MEYLISIYVFLLGLIIGSFLNALIWRLHKKESMTGRSHCPKCRSQISWYDNIPVLSYILLRGRCRYCRKPISWQYPVVELIAGILFACSFFVEAGSWKLEAGNILLQTSNFKLLISIFRDFILISVMIVIFIYDLRWYLILDKVTVPAFLILGVLNLYLGMDWRKMLISVIIGSSFFLIQFLISKGRWIGGGDIRLGALMGVSLGWPNILVAIFLAYILGSIIGIGLIMSEKKAWGSKVPFGTFLSAATLIVLFWGREILEWYLGLFKF